MLTRSQHALLYVSIAESYANLDAAQRRRRTTTSPPPPSPQTTTWKSICFALLALLCVFGSLRVLLYFAPPRQAVTNAINTVLECILKMLKSGVAMLLEHNSPHIRTAFTICTTLCILLWNFFL